MSNIKEVAAHAGVSVPTVYKVFSNTYYTSPEIEEKVLNAAQQLGYVPKSALKKDDDGTPKLFALFVDEIVNPFYSRMTREISREIRRRGNSLLVMYSNGDAKTEEANLELVLSHRCDGLIIVPTPDGNKDTFSKLKRKGFPILQLFRTVHSQFDTLLIDDELGTLLATRHLIKSGHEKIMLISRTNSAIVKREIGYKQAFSEAGMKVDENLLYLVDYAECTKAMITEKIQSENPTAIISVGESTSINVIQALNEMKLTIPDDVSLIINDDLAWAATYGITTIGHSYETIGKLVAEMLDSQIHRSTDKFSGKLQPARLVIDPMLLSRNSVKILSGQQ